MVLRMFAKMAVSRIVSRMMRMSLIQIAHR